MKIFATLALTILVAMLPQLHGKPMDYVEEQAIAELLKSLLQEENIAQEVSVQTDLAMMESEFSLEVVDCDEITEEIQKSRFFKFKHQGDISYKGLIEAIPTYKLVGRNVERQLHRA